MRAQLLVSHASTQCVCVSSCHMFQQSALIVRIIPWFCSFLCLQVEKRHCGDIVSSWCEKMSCIAMKTCVCKWAPEKMTQVSLLGSSATMTLIYGSKSRLPQVSGNAVWTTSIMKTSKTKKWKRSFVSQATHDWTPLSLKRNTRTILSDFRRFLYSLTTFFQPDTSRVKSDAGAKRIQNTLIH